MLTKLPEGTTRKAGYDDSGWTTYERRSAEQIKKVYLYEAKWKLVLDLGAEDAEKSRNWPLDPNGFDALIDTGLHPCGHFALCRGCADRLNPRRCPICRTPIQQYRAPPTVETSPPLVRLHWSKWNS